ncbi:MAG TPA: hypothetical protein VF707_09250 [Ardenticatenaceae bacterium]|jgi:hypothetical protein
MNPLALLSSFMLRAQVVLSRYRPQLRVVLAAAIVAYCVGTSDTLALLLLVWELLD